MRLLRLTGRALGSSVLLLLSAWAVLALFFDFNFSAWRIAAAALYAALLLAALFRCQGLVRRALLAGSGFLMVLAWWLTLQPSNQGTWQADVSHTPYADVQGPRITFTNVRSCDYRAELDYSCQWLARQIDLNDVRGVDLFMDYWGSPWIAHTLVSFQFAPGADGRQPDPLTFSIEARKQAGQSYSSVRGFFRQYTLISIVSNERDLIRLRTNYRHGEDVYLFHTMATPAFARSLLLNYVAFTNHLRAQPQWYNAITRNCTTEIFTFQAMQGRPRDWRVLLNGKSDAMLYDQNELAAGTPRQSFEKLKQGAYINPAAQAADQDPDFPARIRQGRPGFAAWRLDPARDGVRATACGRCVMVARVALRRGTRP